MLRGGGELMMITLLMFGLFALATMGGVAIAWAGSNAVHTTSSTVGVLGCLGAVFVTTTLMLATTATNTGL